ncbi:stomatin mitochondrial [Brachionus plicatilis]|uniref:Stomatin mitochondrial n=1 Tax=Brachionus plicatilis TaxID=10195 RepID=A0A3M7R070_BRAPC|nr:stomatin mitochondrial [Brachionus plicatilis]
MSRLLLNRTRTLVPKLLRIGSSSEILSASYSNNSTPINFGILFVPQQEAWVIERMGKFNKILSPGLNFLIPVIDKVKYLQSLKEIVIDIPVQSAITKDNVTLKLDGVLYLKIFDPYLASYGVDDAEHAITQLAQTTMRSELGKIVLDSVFRERESLNIAIVESINKAANAWGINCLRYEIRDVKLPEKVQEAMQMQVEAERKKRAAILESEGLREASINKAEGEKRSKILVSEANQLEQINRAQGEAEALMRVAKAKADSISLVAESLKLNKGEESAGLFLAQQYVNEFGKLAKTNNTVIMPGDISNVNSMVTQALSIYKTLNRNESTEIKSQTESN